MKRVFAAKYRCIKNTAGPSSDLAVFQMVQRFDKNLLNMVVIQAVKNGFAFFSSLHDS